MRAQTTLLQVLLPQATQGVVMIALRTSSWCWWCFVVRSYGCPGAYLTGVNETAWKAPATSLALALKTPIAEEDSCPSGGFWRLVHDLEVGCNRATALLVAA